MGVHELLDSENFSNADSKSWDINYYGWMEERGEREREREGKPKKG